MRYKYPIISVFYKKVGVLNSRFWLCFTSSIYLYIYISITKKISYQCKICIINIINSFMLKVSNMPRHVIPYNLISLKSNPPRLHSIAMSSRLWSKTCVWCRRHLEGLLEHSSFTRGGINAIIGIWKSMMLNWSEEVASLPATIPICTSYNII